MPRPPSRPRPNVLAASLGNVQQLDAVAKPYADAVRKVLPTSGGIKDVLTGVWLGHPLHPAITDVTIGTWFSATLLDVFGGRDAESAAQRLIGIGIAAALPTAASGASDWVDSEIADAEVRRVGVVHATANVGALALYSASLAARRNGRRGLGVALGLAGAGVVAGSSYLGGHLSFAKGVGVDETASGQRVEDWSDACAEGDVLEDGMTHAQVDGVDVVLLRRGGQIFALANRCAHRGGPLNEGQLVDGCVECPWHGSRYRVDDGSVERGPSPYPQPIYDVRVVGGRVEVRTPEWAHEQ
jgi:nitrite reductase/ring-hydroxylating ferredoxin subunit/uncharacterized membrane protein